MGSDARRMGECRDPGNGFSMQSLQRDWLHRPTHRQVWRLAGPMIASNLTVPLVSLVDSIVAGHLPHAEQLGAVAVGSAVYSLPVLICGFLRMGTIGFAAQAAGRTDGDTLRRVLLQALLLAGALASVILLLALPLLPSVLELMKPSAGLDGFTVTYLHVRLAGLPAALLGYALVGWYLGMQNAGMALRVTVITNAVNIAFNLILVLGLHRGVGGIALASVIGEWTGALVGLLGVSGQLRRYPGRLHASVMGRWKSWQPLLAVNRDILIRSLVLQGVFFAVTVLGARLGDGMVAANALLLNGLLVASFALDGLANAIEALTGHALGRGDPVALRRALVVAGGWSLLGGVLFAMFFALFGKVFIDLQTDIAKVRSLAYPYLPYLAALPLVAVGSYLLDGLFVGASRAREMRDSMLIAGIAFALLAAGLRPWGNHGLWLAFLGFMLVRAAAMGWTAKRIARRGEWVTAADHQAGEPAS
ncbi:multidrug resistance protein, MATE family [Rhodanobacter glycinis]|uniref:Multidrug resistance protein, MATE family n=2 Tax=Rhodanobacteraceae TaxID=1775411 RepID=A0A1I4EBT1_9GAMM|nr:multidrug resistance protein, MATE family [Rhodanobacter glycinis]